MPRSPWSLLLRSAVASALLWGCSDSTGVDISSGGARFRYADNQSLSFTAVTDSALFRVGPDSSFLAIAYVAASGSHAARRFTWFIDSLGGTQLPVGSYTVNVASPLLSGFDMRTAVEIAGADSGTITVTRSDSVSLAGTVDLFLSYTQFPTTQPAPFHLTGSFVFNRYDGGALP